ncbi:MAG: MFS transporter [Actinobacteria bacterium]|nr:MFS transporter [Actinomycetota bacterium]
MERFAVRLEPRDDLTVLEVEVPDGDPGVDRAEDRRAPDAAARAGTRTFRSEGGPFSHYVREVRWHRTGDELVVDQHLEWRLAFPYWRWLYRPLIGRVLANGLAPGARPWWLFPDRLSARQAQTVATMSLFSLVAGLLFGQLTQVLTFASSDIGDGSSGEQALIFALVRIGAVLTAFAMVQADRFGRRRVAIWVFGLAIATSLATALAPSLAVLTVLQAVSRNLAVAGLLAVDTISVEELPAGSRAMAAGLGAMAYGLGAGIAVLALPLADLTPWGWRLVFAMSVITVPMLVSGARNLGESRRFQLLASEPVGTPHRRISGTRFVLLAALFLLVNLFVAPVSQLQNDYLRADRGFSGMTITIFTVLTGTPAAIGVILGGRLADGRGRRVALVPGLVALGVFTAVFFWVAGPAMWTSALVAGLLGALTVAPLGVLAPELFPTARRGGARGALNVLAVLGSVSGLVLAGAGVDAWGYGPAFTLLALGPIVAAGLAFAVPETRGRELEDINQGG